MSKPSSGKSIGFVIASTVAHLTLASAILTLQPQSSRQPEMMEIEVQGALGESQEMPQAQQSPAVEETPAAAEPVAETTAKSDIVAPTPVVQKSQPVPAKSAPPTVLPVAQKAPVQAVADIPTQEESPVETPVEDDQQQEALAQQQQADEAAALAAAAAAANQAQLEKEALDKKNLEEQAAQEQKAADQAAIVAAQQQAEQENLEKEKQAEAAQIASQVAADKKAQEDAIAAQTKADELAKAQAAAAALLAAQEAEEAKAGQAQGVAQSESQVPAGTPSGVRDVSELKQMPGNKKPSYDSEDRLRRRQGEVAFLAYVSKDGKALQFKMVKSSGHRELDSKTFKAIRDWKFYPGQEGWVEIPFKWDLKGGAQEAPATLRRKVSQN